MGRTFWQFIGVLLVIGFVGAYFWWIVMVLALAGLVWLTMRAYPIALGDFEANTQRRAQQSAELVRRADQSNSLMPPTESSRRA
jgi:hypothetical protein